MAEVAPSAGGGGANRTFVLIIAGLAALLFIGLLALGAITFLPGLFGTGNPISLVLTETPTRIVIPPTASRPPQATPTLVVVAQNTVAAAPTETLAPLMTATPIPITATPILITATPGATVTTEALPESGMGEDLLMLFAGGLVLVGLIVVARRMRSS